MVAERSTQIVESNCVSKRRRALSALAQIRIQLQEGAKLLDLALAVTHSVESGMPISLLES